MTGAEGQFGGDGVSRFIRRGPDRDEEALDWHVRLTSGEADEHDRAAFTRWHTDAANARAYAEINDLWTGLGSVLAPTAGAVPLRRRRSGRATADRRIVALAASLLAMVGAGYEYVHVWRYDYVATGSAREFAMLPDGSRVALNTGAAIDVDYSNGKRKVTLARGEAFFDVRHNSNRPFLVDAGSGDVRVLGTAFSVARDGSAGRVIVQRGRVRVRSGRDSIDIVPNESVTFAPAGNGRVVPVQADAVLGWTMGRLFFKDRRLGDVVDEIGRYQPGLVVLRNSIAADRRISAVVQIGRIDEWFDALGETQGLTVRRLPGITIIS